MGKRDSDATLTAQVILRSSSGKALSDLDHDPSHAELEALRAAPRSGAAVRSHFEGVGLKVIADEMGLTMTLTGPVSAFNLAFGARPTELLGSTARSPRHLAVPLALADHVEEITILPRPDWP